MCTRLKRLKRAHDDGGPKKLIATLAARASSAWKAASATKVDGGTPLPPFPNVRPEGSYDWYADQGMEIPAHSPSISSPPSPTGYNQVHAKLSNTTALAKAVDLLFDEAEKLKNTSHNSKAKKYMWNRRKTLRGGT